MTTNLAEPVSTHEKCEVCHKSVDVSRINCPHCGHWLGFPNVRQASEEDETAALSARYDDAFAYHSAEGSDRELLAYEQSVAIESFAAVNRSPQDLFALLLSSDDMSGNYYVDLGAHRRKPGSDGWNQLREIVDPVVFPGYHEDIRFAALVLDKRGLSSYGSCSIILKETMIAARSTVFDQNSLVWVKDQDPRLSALRSLPIGYRGTWAGRGKVAVAKLGTTAFDSAKTYDELLVKRGSDTSNDDFVEVHIWGQYTVEALEKIVLPASPNPDDTPYILTLELQIDSRGIPREVA